MPSFFGVGLDRAGEPLFSHLVRWQNTRRIRTFFSADLLESIGDYSGLDELEGTLPASFDRWDCLSKAQYLEMSIFMSNYLLSSQGDRVAMAHGVEVRPPYLDHRIIEFMGRVPQKWKIRGLNEKYILKRIFQGILPERILSRPKQPYRAPIYQGLLNRHLPPIEESISDKSLKGAGLFDAIKVKKLVQKLQTINNASEFDSMALVGIVSSQILHDQFISHFLAQPVQPINPKLIVDKRRLHPS
jgi:asparagine synthase (glutamine-hydrolysing)